MNKLCTKIIGFIKKSNCSRFLVLLFIVSIFIPGCSIYKTQKRSPTLSSITTNQIYRVRVRTGNLVLDKIAFAYAHDAFSKHLVLSKEGPYTGYIDITFKSTSNAPLKLPSIVNWSNPLDWSSPGYKTNVAYGDIWYTGNKKIGTKGISQFTETEINEGGLLTWHDGIMTVTMKGTDNRKFWSTEYTYKGGWNPSKLVYTYTADGAVQHSIDAVIEEFERDYIVEPMEIAAAEKALAIKAAEDEDAAKRAGLEYVSEEKEEQKPLIALFKKSDKPPPPVKIVRMDEKRWKFSGNNREDVPVYIDKSTIYYPDAYVVQLWAATVRNNIKKTRLYEIGCLENEYRIIDKSSDKSELILKWLEEWTTIFPESTPELLYNAVCPKNARLKKLLHQETKTTTAESKSPEKEIQSPAPEDTVEKAHMFSEKKGAVHMDAKRWKYVGDNHEEIPVHIDKTTIYYPDAYVVQLWAATIGDNTKKTRLYEIGCLENEYRIIDKAPDKSSLTSQWSEEWRTIFPESTPELIYNAVCPKNARLKKLLHQKTKTDIAESKSPDPEKVIQESKDIAKDVQPPAPGEAVEKTAKPQTVSLKNIMEDPVPEEAIQMDTKRWKYIGNNQEGSPVHIDKLTISYPAAYVVNLWAATINDNQKKLNIYEIRCLENQFRIIDEAPEKSSFFSFKSQEWKDISPESTAGLIYKTVCPKKIKIGQKMASR